MRVFDASSLVHAWDNYPIGNFPRFWEWLQEELTSGRMQLCQVAYEEIGHVCPDCTTWLDSIGAQVVAIDNAIVAHAQAIKILLEIVDDNYGSGVDENDILIISTAKSNSGMLVSNEARQPSLPTSPKRYKIPAVCALPEVGVTCENVAETIKGSNRVF